MPDSAAPWLMSNADLDEVIRADKRLARWTAGALAAVLVVGAAGLTIVSFRLDHEAQGVPLASMLIVAAFLAISAVVVPLVVLGSHRSRRRRWERRERECRELAHIAKSINDPALGDLITFNFRLMHRFVAVAITQSRTSYFACIGAATAGLLVLLVGATAALSVQDLAGQITAAVLTAVGAALSSFLSVVFLRPFQMTAKQMSYYYGQPLVHCYLLHAEWLAERFGEEADPTLRWKLRHELVRAALDAARNAQDHLLDLQIGGGRAGARVVSG
ncbi:hypothetical protein [Actinoplanes sp. NPDC048796]|uniref:TRADD-N-associated membrane domain-containing protein n=1 Tax=Actinoplanes sp. NPDC048796 TaxID=3155640 RepID=UPI0033C7CF2E